MICQFLHTSNIEPYLCIESETHAIDTHSRHACLFSWEFFAFASSNAVFFFFFKFKQTEVIITQQIIAMHAPVEQLTFKQRYQLVVIFTDVKSQHQRSLLKMS